MSFNIPAELLYTEPANREVNIIRKHCNSYGDPKSSYLPQLEKLASLP